MRDDVYRACFDHRHTYVNGCSEIYLLDRVTRMLHFELVICKFSYNRSVYFTFLEVTILSCALKNIHACKHAGCIPQISLLLTAVQLHGV